MMKLLVLVCCLGLAVAAPQLGEQEDNFDIPQARSQEDIDEYRRYLEKAKPNNDSLEDAMAKNPLASPWENSGKYQGDIVLSDEEIEDMVDEYAGNVTGRTALRRPYGLWPGRVVIWDIAPGYFNQQQINQITAAFHLFNTRTCVRFRRRTNERSFVRITGRSDGCYAHVGHFRNFVHTFNLARGCFHHYIIVHEWIHVVGFFHMHQTYTRYNYIWINWQNMNNDIRRAFYMHRAQDRDMLRLPYEYASNQHYGPYAFSNNGRPTIGARRANGHLMGHLSFVTGWDIQRINRLYGCPGAWSTPVNPEDANTPAYYGPQTYEEEQALGEKIRLEQDLEYELRLQQLEKDGQEQVLDDEQTQQLFDEEQSLGEEEMFEKPSEIVGENVYDETDQ